MAQNGAKAVMVQYCTIRLYACCRTYRMSTCADLEEQMHGFVALPPDSLGFVRFVSGVASLVSTIGDVLIINI